MTYQALYRKYRPSSFDEVVGQKQIVQTLKNAIEQDRIAHAYLFCGPRGTGKTSIAKIFARTLNCTGDPKPCMTCENCVSSLNGSHPDIVEIDAASNNGVDEVRNLIDKVAYAPMMGRYKIYIIDEVHMMTTGAFNALLKTIEEPPAHVIFILATTEPQKVLPTILSRCQRFDFSKVAASEMKKRIQQICEAENIESDDDAVDLITDLADGGMRDALSILDQSLAYAPDHITAESIRCIYGVVRPQDIGEIFLKIHTDQIEESMQLFNEIYDGGMDLKRFTQDFISLLKNSLILELSPNTVLVSEQIRSICEQYFLPIPLQKRIDLLSDLMDVYQKLAYASNGADYIQTVLLKSAYRKKQNPIGGISDPHLMKQKKPELKSENPKKSVAPISKERKVSPNHSISTSFWKYDVSRETYQPRAEEESEVIYSDDFILSLMNAGDKSIRKSDEVIFNDLTPYMSDMKYARFAGVLEKTRLIASGETFLLVAAHSIMQANEINRLEKQVGFEEFTEYALNACKRVYAIDTEQQKRCLAQFVERMKAGTLPEPANIKVEKKKSEQSQEDPVEHLKSVFPELTVVQD